MKDDADRLAEISAWIDANPVNASRTPLEQLLLRMHVKLAEEEGEANAAIIGMTGQNPRKGVTHDMDDVIGELLDKAIVALGCVEHVTGNQGRSLGLLHEKIMKVYTRMIAGPPASRVT